MQRIDFQDLPNMDVPYDANTFNTLQDNIEDAINLCVGSDGTLDIIVGDTQPTPQSGKTIIWIDTSE